MSRKTGRYTRRGFFKLAGAAGIVSMVATMGNAAGTLDQPTTNNRGIKPMPTRPFGKTGVDVSILAMGGSQDLLSKPLLLRQAVLMGVTYWDTSEAYGRGNSERAIGNYFNQYSEDRKKIFLVTKTKQREPGEMTRQLESSLERLQTDYVDLFFIHGLSDVKNGMDHREVKGWVEKTRKTGKIRFFGFSTHKNMGRCLPEAAKLGWIDGIMTSYNYRLMHSDDMKRAISACAKAGIGLTAMKTQAPFMARFWSSIGKESDTAIKMTERFQNRGFTPEQAKLKAVWEIPHIATICSEMTNMTILKANVEAAQDRVMLSRDDKQLLDRFARETAFGYCAGCADRCESVVEDRIPISDIARYLMYHHNYGEYREAVRRFRELPSFKRRSLARTDYSQAERCCPQGVPIGKLMEAALETFA